MPGKALIISALFLSTLLSAEGIRKDGGDTFLQPLQKRDSVLVADQFRYGIVLENIPDGTPLALPEMKADKDSPLEILGEWQLDSTRVSKRREKPARYDIRASLIITTFMGGRYTLPDIPVLVNADTLVFRAPQEALEVKELPVDMDSFEPHDIKPQVRFPYTPAELFPWIYGTLMILMAIAALVLWLRYREKAEAENTIREAPHIRALRKLDHFRGDKFWKPENQKAFYSGVTDALREYMAHRYAVGALEMTTAEIFQALEKADIPDELYAEMKSLFERADFVKFAKFTAGDEENAQVLPQAVRFVTTTYQQEIARQAQADENAQQKEEQ